ncbi:MAG: SRPBCC family protein [Silvanigrellaceae bacterium]|nr:SRPBCC family protein [Silvanigrellaceae bacterium]
MDIKVEESISIKMPPADIYKIWRNFENLPSLMNHLKSVDVYDNSHSHWVAKAPLGTSVEWDAIVTEDIPNELIVWQSSKNAEVKNEGRVAFISKSNGQETEVEVKFHYHPPLGKVGVTFAKLFGEEPSQQVKDDLRRFKDILERVVA